MGTSFGRYKVAEELGRGAMGVVYRAVDPAIGRNVAIKAINRTYLESLGVRPEEYAERFQREAQVAGGLNHPHIVKIFDLGPDYLVMEYVDGQTLAAMLRAMGRLPHATALRILGQAAAALDHAHAGGIVHRDIKPANIMVQPDGSVKVMDFGLARIESSTLTAAGEVLGSAAYMAPEVVLGQPADARSDNFSLGVVAYELITGLRPFAGPTVSAIIQSVVRTTPRSVRELDATLPPEVDAVFTRALAKEPAERYPLAGDFARALAAAPWTVSGEPSQLAMPPAEGDAAQATMILATASTLLAPDEPPETGETTTVLSAEVDELLDLDDPPAVESGPPAAGDATALLEATAELRAPLASPPEPEAATATVILSAPTPPPAPAPDDAAPAATLILKPRPAPTAPPVEAETPAATILLKPQAPPAPPQPRATADEGRAATVQLKAAAVPPLAPSASATPAKAATDARPGAPQPGAARAAGSTPASPAPAKSAPSGATPPTPPRPTAPVPPPVPGAGRPSSAAKAPAPAGRRPTPVGFIVGIVALIVVLFGGAVAGFFWLVRSRNATQTAASPAATAESPAPAPTATAPAAAEPEPAPVAEATPEPEPSAAPAAAAPQPATLVISSEPSGANVSVGRRRRGRTPLRLSVPAGAATVVIEKDGFKPWRESARLGAGETRTLQARLEPLAPPRAAPSTPPPAAARPAVREGDLVPLEGDVTPPRKLSGDSPKIPDKVRSRLSGSVVVEFVVGIDGRVSDAKVVTPLNLVVDKAALDAVAGWRYEPARSHGVRVRVTQRAKFTYVSQ